MISECSACAPDGHLDRSDCRYCDGTGSTGRITIDLPHAFYDDHTDRGCGSTGRIIKTLSKTYRVSLDREAFADLRSDARHYGLDSASEFWQDYRALVLSARATLKRLDAA